MNSSTIAVTLASIFPRQSLLVELGYIHLPLNKEGARTLLDQ